MVCRGLASFVEFEGRERQLAEKTAPEAPMGEKSQKRCRSTVDIDADAVPGVSQFRPTFRHADAEGGRDEEGNGRTMVHHLVVKPKGFQILSAIVRR